VESGVPEFGWSVSRHDSFQSCRRKYYYSYYASYEDAEVRRLKKLSALPMWAGTVVHNTIEQFLKTHDALPSEAEQEAIVRAAVHGDMLTDWRDSEGGSERFRLFEHEYEVPVEQDDKRLAVGIVMRSLRHFFRSDVLKEALAAGRENWLTVEDLATFEIDGVPVRLRMDLAFRDREGRVVIVDWKTGRREGRFARIQLASYALFAASRGWAPAADIRTELAHLVVPHHVRTDVDQAAIDGARAFIVKSASRMRELLADPQANVARMEDFARVDRPMDCKRCNFRRLCYPRGAAAVEAAAASPDALPLPA
jgi:hypothetical protein